MRSAPVARAVLRSGLPLAAVLTAGCASTSRFAETRQQPPSPLTVAIAEIDSVRPVADDSGAMYMDASGERLRKLLSDALVRSRAATRVVPLSELSSPLDADVILRPAVTGPVRFSCEGWADAWWASGGLWLVTWIGGMAIADSTYTSDLELACALQFPRSSRTLPQSFAGGNLDVAFLERNDFVSWPTVQSLLLPPFLTSDQVDATREVLTERSMEAAGIELSRYLKRGFEDDAFATERVAVQIDSPANGAEVEGSTVVITGTIRSESEIGAVVVQLPTPGAPVSVAAELSKPANVDARYPASRAFRCEFDGLLPGVNWLRLIVAADDEHSRTIEIRRR